MLQLENSDIHLQVFLVAQLYRGTTVYLADRRFDMLPSVLSERVCSLRHRVDRYAGKKLATYWAIGHSFY